MAALSLLLKCYEARKEFLPAVLSAPESAERREKMFAQMDEVLDAEIERRGL